jgi:putative tryptophan/tyrosine transport system substrate-binding protein
LPPLTSIVLDIVWQGDDPDQAVNEGLRRGAQILIPVGSSASVAAQRQAPKMPIVLIQVGNPTAMGLVDSLARPGRNATGFSDILGNLSGKWVDIARELPNPQGTVGYIWHTGWPDGENRY